jgi:Fe-Mn family superoxide dismutase
MIRSLPAIAAAAGVVSLASSPLLAATETGGPRGFDREAFHDGQYVLPPLPYGYDALEPHIDAETMRLHHDKHHQAYVTNLNKAVKELAAADAAGAAPPAALLSGLQEDISFNAGGHLLHTLFWRVMGPGAGGEPQGMLADVITRDFSSVAAFRARFSAAATGVKGSGWAVLAYEPVADRLMILQVKQHDLQLIPWAEPILPLDVWEHAYYLKYRNARAEYVKSWWNVVNWPVVTEVLQTARRRYHREA